MIKTILPGSTIGILGGGQLGRMTAMEGKKMGYNIICLDPAPNSPCGQVADEQIVAELNNLDAALEMAEKTDILVYEFENIDISIVEELEKRYYLPQKSHILAISQNRIIEKQQLQKAGFPVVPFCLVKTTKDLEQAVKKIGYPCLLKTVSGGYDGKGQQVLKSDRKLEDICEMMKSKKQEMVLEKYIPFTGEISVIVARKASGETAVFPVAENIHRDNILHMTVVPARIPVIVQERAIEMARGIADTFQVTGLLTVEFFVTEQGLLVNELAPRPHNSGHYTWDACFVSQFEQLIRAVCNLPFGSTELFTPVVMINILGSELSEMMAEIHNFGDNIKVHLYGKSGNPSPKRKMGHLIVKTDHPEQVIDAANKKHLFRKLH
jgi:5-(carboxyamino)imidazole ribonucleotide synthase